MLARHAAVLHFRQQQFPVSSAAPTKRLTWNADIGSTFWFTAQLGKSQRAATTRTATPPEAEPDSGLHGLILMDMQMPGMNGLEATRQIRGLPHQAHVPVIAMTGNAFADNRARCMEAGMSEFIAKPYKPQELFARELFAILLMRLSGPGHQVLSRTQMIEPSPVSGLAAGG